MLHALRLLCSNFQHGSIPDPSRACIIERVEGTARRCFSKDENMTVEVLATRYTLKKGKSIGVPCEVLPISFIMGDGIAVWAWGPIMGVACGEATWGAHGLIPVLRIERKG